MMEKPVHVTRAYGIGLLTFAAALGLSFLCYPRVAQAPATLFLAALIAASWVGGCGPGLLVTLLGALAMEYFFVPPLYTLQFTPQSAGAVGAYLFTAALLGSASDGIRVARWRAEQAREAAETLHSQLRAAVEAADLRAFAWDLAAADTVPASGFPGSITDLRLSTRHASLDGVAPEDRERVRSRQEAALRTGTYSSEHRCLTGSGEVRWVLERGRVTYDGQHRPLRLNGVALDVTEWEKAAEAARLLAAIVASTDDAVVGLSLEGVVTAWNGGAERLYGYPAAEVTGRHISFLIPSSASDDLEETLERVRQGERVERLETIRRSRDGRLVAVSLTVSPIRDRDGRISGASSIARDVTRQRELEWGLREQAAIIQAKNRELEQGRQELLARNQQLEQQDRFRNEYLAMLAHELRNPLAPIQYAVGVLRAGVGPEDPSLRVIERQCDHLARMVGDLLDLSRVTQGKIRLDLRPEDLAEVVHAAVQTCQPLVSQRGHTLIVRLPDRPLEVHADGTRLVQVICNLLTNAAKYTEPGGRIELEVEALPGPEGDEEFVLRVRDNGRGIDPALLPYIFDIFVQAERTLDRSEGGLGVGLSLVKSLVEMHGGRVEAFSSGLGQGSEFVVRLPRTAPAEPEPAAARVTPSAAWAKARSVLLVEDNEDAAETLRELLTLWGWDCRRAAAGPEGLELARQQPPDVVLLDIGLPGMDGYEVARRLRQDLRLKDCLLVAITGYGQPDDQRRALEAGFNHHLTKPVNPAVLQQLLPAPSGTVLPS